MSAKLYTTVEAAEQLHISADWLKKQVARKQVQHVRMGRAVRFTDAHIAAIIASREQPIATRGGKRSKL